MSFSGGKGSLGYGVGVCSDGSGTIFSSTDSGAIFPNNFSLCKENCKEKGVVIEDERVICSFNLNSNKSYEDKEDNNFFEEDEIFISYLLDNNNYNNNKF